MLTKSDLRSHIRQKRKVLDEDHLKERSVRITDNLFSIKEIIDKNSFMIYSDFDNEVMTCYISQRLSDMSKAVFMPVVKGEDIHIYPLTDDMKVNQFGIKEPECTGICAKPSDIDVYIIPGICFDKKGGRIGFGRGYYDRLLADARRDAVKVAIAFEFQLVDDAFSEDHDIMMDYIITENKIIRTR